MLKFLCGNFVNTCCAKSRVFSGRRIRVELAIVKVKNKVVPTCDMIAYGGIECTAPLILNLETILGGVWSSSRFDCFTPGEKHPSVNLIRGWMSPAAGRDVTRDTYVTGDWAVPQNRLR
jgi:hypothetical protein